MWFIFPQIAGLGSSPMAQQYRYLWSRGGAHYLAHPTARSAFARMHSCIGGLTAPSTTSSAIPTTSEFRSSVTLFAAVAPTRTHLPRRAGQIPSPASPTPPRFPGSEPGATRYSFVAHDLHRRRNAGPAAPETHLPLPRHTSSDPPAATVSSRPSHRRDTSRTRSSPPPSSAVR